MAVATSSGTQTRELDQTATWAVAGVCAIFILVSIALEKVLHKVGKVRNITSSKYVLSQRFLNIVARLFREH